MLKKNNIIKMLATGIIKSRKQLNVVADIDQLNEGIFEGNYIPEIVAYLVSNGTNPNGLFDLETWDVIAWNTPDVVYWRYSSHYVTLKLPVASVIYSRSGAWLSTQMGQLDVYEINPDGTETFVLTTSEGLYREYNVLCELDAGTYKFKLASNVTRIDSSWLVFPK